MTVWQKMVNEWNDEKFAPMKMVLLPQLSTHFIVSRVISLD
jgi:hypothetical protein